jgi:predicted  nucleic acid-binding Zn-ribbon protein
MFDDPALWEGADKKALDDGKDAEMHEAFWGGDAVEEEKHEEKDDSTSEKMMLMTSAGESKHSLPAAMSGSFTESDGGWAEAAQHGVPLGDDFAESPVLGRGEPAPVISREPGGLLRRPAGAGEPVGGLLKERCEPEPAARSMSSGVEFRRSPTRGLPAVQEVPEAEAVEAQYNWPTPEMKRDSGFAPESPNPQRRRSLGFQDEQQRDSGIHTDDYKDGKMQMQTPEPSREKKLQRSPFATPVLAEPGAAAATPEPEKKRSRRTAKDYGEVGLMGATAAAATGGGLVALAATTPKDTPERRSVSDSLQRRGPSASVSPRAEPVARRSVSNTSLSRKHTPEPLKFRPESPGIQRSTPTPPLRRIDKRLSGDLRALRQQRSFNSTPTPTSSATATAADPQVLPPPVANESRVRSKGEEQDMADVYDGFGEGRIGSPRSPTRPHSMRRRQSMQVLELESRVDQLMAENRMLTEARTHAEQTLNQKAAGVLSDRDSEIEALKQSLQFLQNEVTRLAEVNEGLTSANAELASKDTGRFADMTRELDEARGVHTTFTQSLQDKDAEIADLRAQLDEAKEQIRQMQRKILESKAGDSSFLDLKDEDYFDHRCQQLCSHVQQWVLRFSKFSDMRACRLTNEINDEKTIDRLDNAILDGTDVDVYLRDRVKRRDIFMSMTMNMIWEFVFTRYLFGMDREQRQKLKSLEKLLTEVGPVQAVRQWRAVTLTLLSKRGSFKEQRNLDTEAVVQAVFQTLCKILPPPSNLEGQIQSQLRRVMHEAVDLSIEMRTQRAEYMMLPPLQPEYDADGELAATVPFDAAMMNERSGSAGMPNEDLEAQGAVVRAVLFPLVVKRGDDEGCGEDKIVVCPAQVLIARDDRGRRHYTPSSETGGASLGAPSRISLVTETMGQPEV